MFVRMWLVCRFVSCSVVQCVCPVYSKRCFCYCSGMYSFTTLEVSGLGRIPYSCLGHTCLFLVYTFTLFYWGTYSCCYACHNYPRRACAARVWQLGLSVILHLISLVFVRLTKDTTYLTCNEGQTFRTVFSENAPLQSQSASSPPY